MNCQLCLGKLWLLDASGDYFRCGECNGTGEKYARARVIDFESARRVRDNRRRRKVDTDDKGPDAA